MQGFGPDRLQGSLPTSVTVTVILIFVIDFNSLSNSSHQPHSQEHFSVHVLAPLANILESF